MKVRELKESELSKARNSAWKGCYNATFKDGWDAAIAYVRRIEECHCRCYSCKKPLIYPWDIDFTPDTSIIGVYGGDICGEINFCKECWSKLSKDERKKILRENFPNNY